VDDLIQRVDGELEASEREMRDVRAILADAAERLLADFSRGQGLATLQFQDISDQILATTLRRVATVRVLIRVAEGPYPAMPSPVTPVGRADLQPGSAELF
jgi:anti-sigma factor RsiW